mgnify:CR=1 FL=1
MAIHIITLAFLAAMETLKQWFVLAAVPCQCMTCNVPDSITSTKRQSLSAFGPHFSHCPRCNLVLPLAIDSCTPAAHRSSGLVYFMIIFPCFVIGLTNTANDSTVSINLPPSAIIPPIRNFNRVKRQLVVMCTHCDHD